MVLESHKDPPMSSRRPARLRRRFTLILGLVTVCFLIPAGIWMIANWNLLFRVPAVWEDLRWHAAGWRQARSEASLDPFPVFEDHEDDSSLTVELEWSIQAFNFQQAWLHWKEMNRLAKELILLQDPDFSGEAPFSLQVIPTEDGSKVYLLCYSSGNEERVPHPARSTILPERYYWHHRFLDARGRLFVPRSPVFLGHDWDGDHSKGRKYRRKPGIYWSLGAIPLSMRGPYHGDRLYTWGAGGFVPHGFIRDDPWATPWIDHDLSEHDDLWDSPLDSRDVARQEKLLGSFEVVDILSGLNLLERNLRSTWDWRRAGLESEPWRRFLDHPDPDVRTRALSFVSFGEAAEIASKYLDDPAPRVRITAAQMVVQMECHRRKSIYRALARDEDRHVAAQANRELMRSADLETACEAFERLLESRIPFDLERRHSTRCGSVRTATLTVEWLEEFIRTRPPGEHPFRRDFHHVLEGFEREHLLPQASRLLEVFRKIDPEREVDRGLWHALLRVLLRLELPEMDEALRVSARRIWSCRSFVPLEDDGLQAPLLQALIRRAEPLEFEAWISLTLEAIEAREGSTLSQARILHAWSALETEKLAEILLETYDQWDHVVEQAGDLGRDIFGPEVVGEMVRRFPEGKLFPPGLLRILYHLEEPLPGLVERLERDLGRVSPESDREIQFRPESRKLATLAILVQWEVPGVVERLDELLVDLDPVWHGNQEIIFTRPGLGEHESVGEFFLKILDREGFHVTPRERDPDGEKSHLAEENEVPDVYAYFHGEIWPRDNPLEALLDGLQARHADCPLLPLVPVLERVARAEIPSSLRAAIRLFEWKIEGSRELLLEVAGQTCRYFWRDSFDPPLPESVLAVLAELE